jgi:xylulokinase
MGGHDQPCGALGAGCTRPGQVADSAGTYECLVAISDQPLNTPQALTYALNSYCHVVAGQYVTLAFFPAGLMVRWFVEQFCFQDEVEARESHRSLYEVLEAHVAGLAAGPTGLCVTPHLIGSCNPNWDVRATGIIAGLTPGVTRHHLYKAIYEGLACELALNLEVLEQVVGPLERVRIYGGGARTPFTVQLRADLTGKTFELLSTPEAACQGAAMLAGLAAGVYGDLEEAAAKLVSVSREFTPDPVAARSYAGQSEEYRQIYPAFAAMRARAINSGEQES